MESNTRTSAFVRLARLLLTLLIMVASVPACMQPQVYRTEVPVPYSLPAQLPPGAERLPLKVGIYYSPEFENYEHYDRTVGESGVATPVGEFSIRQFDSMFFAMFEHTQSVDRRPPYPANDPASELQGIIEPRIERFEMNAEAMSFAPLFAQVDYQFKIYLPDGTTLATWKISASDTGVPWSASWTDIIGVRTKTVVRESSIQFMQKFFDAPEVRARLAEIREKKAGAAQLAKAPDSAFAVNAAALTSGAAAVVANMTLEGVDVSAKLYWQVGPTRIPVGNSSVKSQILAAHLTVKNNRAEPIVIDPSKLRLRTNRFATLTPDSAQSVAQRMFRDGTYGDDGTAAILAGGIIGVLVAMDQANVNDQMIRSTTDELRRAQLDDQTIAPNQSVSGIVYFIALGIDRNLERPELRVSVVDPSHRKSYETTLDLTTGAATGGTLLLAGLKPPESVPERIKVVEAPQQAEEAADTTTSPLRVGILPPAFLNPTLPSNTDKEMDIYSEIHRYIHSKPNFDVSYDYGARYGAGPLDTHAVWQGSVVKKVPDKAKMRAIGEELAVDVLVLAWITGNKTNTIIDLYVFEVASGKMYHDTNALGRAKGLVASTFGPIERQQARQRDSTITASGGTLHLAGSKPPESVPEKTVARAAPESAAEPAVTLEAGQLSGAEVLKFLSGNTISGRNERYVDFHTYLSPDGKMSGKAKMTRYDAGNWQVMDDGTYCRQWDRWLSGARRCFKVFRSWENRIRFRAMDSGNEATVRVRFGDPENLKGRI